MATLSSYVAPKSYSSYSSAIQDLTKQMNDPRTKGRTGANTFLAGSDAAAIGQQIGALQNAREVDPWSLYRGAAADQLAGSMTNDPTKIYTSRLEQMVNGEFGPDDPSYDWRYQQGLQANERSLAAKGLLNSGNAAIELQNYGQNAASQEYQAQFSRLLQALGGVSDSYNQTQTRLMALAGVGNSGALTSRMGVQQDAMDNASYQQGIYASMNQQGNPLAGYSFG